MHESFVLFTEIKDVVDSLSNEQRGMLFKAIIDYESGEEPRIDDAVVKVAFLPIKRNLDRTDAKWEKEKASRSEAGKKGMESRWGKKKGSNKSETITNDNTVITNDNTVTKAITNVTVPVNVPVSVPVNETVNESPTETKKKSKKEKAAPTLSVEQMQDIVLQSELGCQVQDKVRDWIEYKHQRNEPYKDMGFKSLITQIGKHEREAGADAVCDLIDLCMSNEWKGIIWEKLQRSARADPGGKVDWDRV